MGQMGSLKSNNSTNAKMENNTNLRRQLEELYPSGSLSIELPSAGNGNLYQVRTTIYSEIFYGRSLSEREAIDKCCQKAIKHINQYWYPNCSADVKTNIRYGETRKKKPVVSRKSRTIHESSTTRREVAIVTNFSENYTTKDYEEPFVPLDMTKLARGMKEDRMAF